MTVRWKHTRSPTLPSGANGAPGYLVPQDINLWIVIRLPDSFMPPTKTPNEPIINSFCPPRHLPFTGGSFATCARRGAGLAARRVLGFKALRQCLTRLNQVDSGFRDEVEGEKGAGCRGFGASVLGGAALCRESFSHLLPGSAGLPCCQIAGRGVRSVGPGPSGWGRGGAQAADPCEAGGRGAASPRASLQGQLRGRSRPLPGRPASPALDREAPEGEPRTTPGGAAAPGDLRSPAVTPHLHLEDPPDPTPSPRRLPG